METMKDLTHHFATISIPELVKTIVRLFNDINRDTSLVVMVW